MSNDYYTYQNTFLAGALARAEELATELTALQTAFDLLPTPEPGGNGFTTSFTVPNPTQDAHVANWGTLKALEASSLAANTSALAAEDNITNTLLPDITSKHGEVSTWHGDVQTWRAETATYRDDAQTAAQQAILATSGARTWQEGWDASGGALPIPTPVAGDEGKYWKITVGGTLPQVGAVIVEDELSIKADLSYEILPANLSVTSVAGKTGAVTLTKSDVGLNDVANYAISDLLTLNSSGSYASSKAAYDLKVLVDAAQSDATQALSNAASAQTTANTGVTDAANAQSTADTALSTANTAVSNAAAAQSTANGAVSVNTTQGTDITNLKKSVALSGTNTIIKSNGNGDVYLQANGVNIMRIDANGEVYFKGHIHVNQGSV